jgi:hypothetical protein
MKITVPISVGELLDKISILQIKSQHTTSEYVKQELKDLIEIAKQHQVYNEQELQSLIEINSKLWDIEDDLRRIEKEQKENNTFTFDHTFISLARSVYITNDERARIKKEINEKYNSQYQEVKCYV